MKRRPICRASSISPRKLGLGKWRFTLLSDFDSLAEDEIRVMFAGDA